jgi:hypothetical protein
MVNVSIVGHSHARNLKDWMKKKDKDGKGFGVNGAVNVKFFVEGGLTVQRLLRPSGHWILDELHDFRPDVVLVMLGDNDLCSESVDSVLFEFERLMSALRERVSVDRFVFFSCLKRRSGRRYNVYNKKVFDLHCRMSEWKMRPGVLYYNHTRPCFSLTKPTKDIFERDQTHLVAWGYKQLFISVRYGLRSTLKAWFKSVGL